MNNIIKHNDIVILDIIFFILFLSISNIFFTNLPPGVGLSLFVNNIVWLAGVTFVFVAIILAVNRGYWTKPEEFIIHLSLILALVIPFLWSDDNTGRGFYRMLGAVFGIVYFLCLITSFPKKNIWFLILTISLSGLIQAIWGIVQIWIIPESVVPNGIPMGVFQQPNVMASYIATTFTVSLLLISTYPVPFEKMDKWVSHSINLFAFIAGMIIISINPATVYVALAISLPFMLLAHRESPYGILKAIIFLLLGGLFIGLINSGIFLNNDFMSFSMDETFNSGGRKIIWLISWELFKENWLTGVGYGNFEHAYLEYQAGYYQQHGLYGFARVNHPHNELILWSVEGGVLPGLAFVSYTLYTIWRMFKMGAPALPYAAILIPLVAHALLEFPFYHSAIHWILFVTLLYLFETHAAKTKDVSFEYKILIITTTTFSSLLAVLFFITNMHGIYILNKFNESGFNQRNIKVFSSIKNNFTVRPHLDYFTLESLFRKGLLENDESLIKKSILLSEKLNADHPRPEYYKSMLTGYKAIGDKAGFKLKLDEARHYYPLDKYFLEVEEQLGLML